MHTERENERGFILLTSLITLGLMLVLSVGLWYRSAINQQISASGQKSTQAFYYAEAAIHYVAWALGNDAELDGFDHKADETTTPTASIDLYAGNADTVGDWSELEADSFDPGPIVNSGTGYNYGQVGYFDNRPISARYDSSNSACTLNFAFDADNPANLNPDLSEMITCKQMPQHLVLNIDSSGNITIDSDSPSASNTPTNGAVVWLTAVMPDPSTSATDAGVISSAGIVEGDDINLYRMPSSATDDTWCNGSSPGTTNVVGCVNPSGAVGSGSWLTSYNIAAYAVAYVDGIPMRFLRALVLSMPPPP